MKAFKSLIAAAIAATFAWSCPTMAQDFPAKPIKIVLPYPAGTGPDAVMRQVAEKLTQRWRQPVTIENRPGANGWTAVDAVKTAAPDGYTLMQVDNLLFGLQPHVFRKLSFDPVRDFEPVAPLYQTNFFVVVPANSNWRNIADLTAAAKAKEGGLTYGSSGVASHMHIGGTMLETATGVKMTHVPVRDTPQVFVSVANGEIAWAFGTASTSGPMYRAQKVKYLAIAAPTRHPSFPDVPTIAEAGGPPDFELKACIALFAPHGTPKPVIDRINAEITQILSEPDVRERMVAVGFSPWMSSPAELANTLNNDQKLFGEVARREKISLD